MELDCLGSVRLLGGETGVDPVVSPPNATSGRFQVVVMVVVVRSFGGGSGIHSGFRGSVLEWFGRFSSFRRRRIRRKSNRRKTRWRRRRRRRRRRSSNGGRLVRKERGAVSQRKERRRGLIGLRTGTGSRRRRRRKRKSGERTDVELFEGLTRRGRLRWNAVTMMMMMTMTPSLRLPFVPMFRGFVSDRQGAEFALRWPRPRPRALLLLLFRARSLVLPSVDPWTR